jgi:hypothetical protein
MKKIKNFTVTAMIIMIAVFTSSCKKSDENKSLTNVTSPNASENITSKLQAVGPLYNVLLNPVAVSNIGVPINITAKVGLGANTSAPVKLIIDYLGSVCTSSLPDEAGPFLNTTVTSYTAISPAFIYNVGGNSYALDRSYSSSYTFPQYGKYKITYAIIVSTTNTALNRYSSQTICITNI